MAKWDRDLTQVCFEILSYSQSKIKKHENKEKALDLWVPYCLLQCPIHISLPRSFLIPIESLVVIEIGFLAGRVLIV